MKNNRIRIGTRGSKLALYQAERVKSEMKVLFPDISFDIHVIKTKGDKILDTALSKIGDKGLFTKEIENALIDNTVDIAVHSLKDLSTDLPEELQLSAVLERGEFRDALVHKKGKKLSNLDSSDVIATSSLRRIAALKKQCPDVIVTDIRGNVNTRLEKMNNGHCDGMIMAAAGLQRLGLSEYITEILEPTSIIPAVAQGAIAIESRIGDDFTNSLLQKINHSPTLQAVVAERKFLNHLQGGCQVPVGCFSRIDGESITLTGFVATLDGTTYLEESLSSHLNNSIETGEQLAQKLIDLGGKKILDQIRNNS